MALSLPVLKVQLHGGFVDGHYKEADREWVRENVFHDLRYFHRYLVDRQKQLTDKGLAEENPIPVNTDVFVNFFPNWKERIINPKLSVVNIINDPSLEPPPAPEGEGDEAPE